MSGSTATQSTLEAVDDWVEHGLEDLVQAWSRWGRGWPCQGRVVRQDGARVYLVLAEEQFVAQYLETRPDLAEQDFFEDLVAVNEFIKEMGWWDWFPDGMPAALLQRLRHPGYWWDWQAKIPMRHMGCTIMPGVEVQPLFLTELLRSDE